MKKHAEEAKTWTFDNLNDFLHDPKGAVPGTKMAFPGLKDDKERANVIAYLNTLSDNPAPPPTAAEAAPARRPPTPRRRRPATARRQTAPAADAAAAARARSRRRLAGEPRPLPAAPARPLHRSRRPRHGSGARATALPRSATPPQRRRLRAGDATKGEAISKRCAACHNLKQGGGEPVGPHLFGVVGRPVASVADYTYSDAMKTFADGGKGLGPRHARHLPGQSEGRRSGQQDGVSRASRPTPTGRT